MIISCIFCFEEGIQMKENWVMYTWQFTENNRPQVITAIMLGIMSMFMGIIPYFGVFKILDHFFNGTITIPHILLWSTLSIISFVAKHVLFGFATTMAHDAAYTILENIRLRLTAKMTKLPLGKMLNERIGKLKNLVIDQVETIELPLSHLIPEGISYALLPFTIFVYLFMLDWRMAIVSLITIPLALIPFLVALKSLNKNYGPYMEASHEVNSVLVEYSEGLEVIKTFNQTSQSYTKFESAVVDFKAYTVNWFTSSIKTLSMISAILPSSLIGTLPLGLYLYTIGELTPTAYILCLLLSIGIIEPLTKFALFTNHVKQIQYSVEIVQQFLTLEELPNVTQSVSLSEQLSIELKNISFQYDADKPVVVKDIQLTIPEGQFIAFVGPSGSGKSTVAKLITRFWDPTKGDIFIGHTNIKNMPLDQLADTISFVTQDNFLFNDTLLENIRYGNPQATDEQVIEAAKAACCDEFIRYFDKGYETTVGEAGGRLSGGERQRIALARAILKDAPIVILDEATAFTDPENEVKIQQSLRHLTKNKTLIVIAHRLTTVKDADHLYVLNNGEIVEEGQHEELLRLGKCYHNMWHAHINAQQIAVHHDAKEVKPSC